MEDLNAFIARIAVAALTSALFCAAAVFFVVDLSLRGIETAVIATNERFDDVGGRLEDVNARFNGVDTRFDALERSVERSTDLLREDIRAGFANAGKDMRGEIEGRSLEQEEWIQITASTLARLSTILLDAGWNGSDETMANLNEVRVRVAILCRDVLGSNHPDCVKLR